MRHLFASSQLRQAPRPSKRPRAFGGATTAAFGLYLATAADLAPKTRKIEARARTEGKSGNTSHVRKRLSSLSCLPPTHPLMAPTTSWSHLMATHLLALMGK